MSVISLESKKLATAAMCRNVCRPSPRGVDLPTFAGTSPPPAALLAAFCSAVRHPATSRLLVAENPSHPRSENWRGQLLMR
jgi:hypothetical protein